MSDFPSMDRLRLAPHALQVGGWLLPFDVVSHIMTFSRPSGSTISAVMKTCRALYAEGPKHLLYDGVQLSRPNDIAAFANFMLTEDPSRFAYLRKLVFNVAEPSYQARLTELLVHPSLVLETLILRRPNSILEQSEPGLREAFRGLKTIKRIDVFSTQEYSAEIIQNIPSPLESLSISIGSVFSPPDIVPMLRPFSDTLHTLMINFKTIPLHSFFQGLQTRDFDHVRTFGVMWVSSLPEFLATPAFALAFSGIKHLQLIPTTHPSLTKSFTSVTTLEELTRGRIRLDGHAEASGLGDPPPRAVSKLSLPAVEECSGELLNVYKLSLQCTLTTLRLWSTIRAEDMATLRAVLKDTRPQRLLLPTTLGDVPDVFATFDALPTQAPARADLYVVGSWIPDALHPDSSTEALNQIYSILEPLFIRPPPYGLVDLRLVFYVAGEERIRLQGKSPVLGNVGEAFVRWASTATPPLAVTWKFSDDEDELRWPEIDQDRYDGDFVGWCGYDPFEEESDSD